MQHPELTSLWMKLVWWRDWGLPPAPHPCSPLACGSGCILMLGCPGILMLGCPGVLMLGCPGVLMLGCPGIIATNSQRIYIISRNRHGLISRLLLHHVWSSQLLIFLPYSQVTGRSYRQELPLRVRTVEG